MLLQPDIYGYSYKVLRIKDKPIMKYYNSIEIIDLKTVSKEKISPVVFSALFLYDGDLLLGYVDGKIQQVNKN